MHRRIVCHAKDLASGLPHLLFDPDPDPALLRARGLSRVRTVRDWDFGAFDEALEAAHAGDPPADPDAWMDQDEFVWEGEVDQPAPSSGPEDADLELLAVLIGCMVFLSVLNGFMYAAFRLSDWLGVNTPEVMDTFWDNVFGFVAIVGGFGLTYLLANGVPALLARLIRPIRLRPEPPTLLRYASQEPGTDEYRGLFHVPQALRVTARTRIIFVSGWLGCGVLWAAAGVVAQAVVGEPGLTGFCLATGIVLGAVGVRGFQRRLDADPAGVTIHNFFRRVTIPWGQLRTIDFEPVNSVRVDSVPVDSAQLSAEAHRLRFNERVTAEVPAGLTGPGDYLFNLRGILMSMQRANAPEGGSPREADESAHIPQDVQSADYAQDVQDTLPAPDG